MLCLGVSVSVYAYVSFCYVKVMNLTIRRHTRRMSNKVANAMLMPARSTCTKLQQ